MTIHLRMAGALSALAILTILTGPVPPVLGQEVAVRPQPAGSDDCHKSRRDSNDFWIQSSDLDRKGPDSRAFPLQTFPGGLNAEGFSLRQVIPCETPPDFRAARLVQAFGHYEAGRRTSPLEQAATALPMTLSLRQAVDLAKANNLLTQSARERENEARGRALQSSSGLLPDLSGSASQASITTNLASFGFQPGLFAGLTSTFLGPFHVFDARVRLVQNLLNLNAIRRYQSGRVGVLLSRLEQKLAEEQVTSQAALAYLEALRSQQAIAAARADLEMADSLLKLATDQHKAGVATGVDVSRAQTRVAQEQVIVAEAQRAMDQARLQLLRIAGIPLGTEIALTDTMQFNPESAISTDTEVAFAEQNRLEVQIATEQVRLNDYERKAALAEQLPYLEFGGDYGVSGITPRLVDLPTRSVAIRLNVPIFNGGATRGRIEETASRERQSELALNDVRAQVEQDVRLAERTLAATSNAVTAANQALTLAQRELQMARDRFAAGVGDNLEVLNAQTALADARLSHVAALAQYNAARLNLAAALGRAQSFTL